MISIDSMLAQINDVESSLRSNRIDLALHRLAGIRWTLLDLQDGAKPADIAPAVPDNRDLEEAVRGLVFGEQTHRGTTRTSNTRAYEFSSDVKCWGWYEVQHDSRGRAYRWCGGKPEAALVLNNDSHDLRGVALRLRPLLKEQFDEKALEIRLDGRALPVHIIDDENEGYILIVPVPAFPNGNDCIISIFPLKAVVPSERGLSLDARRLAFNIFNIIEIRQKNT